MQLEKEKERFDALIEQAIEQGLATEELERSQRESLKAMRDGFLAEDEAARIKQVEEVKKAEKEKLTHKLRPLRPRRQTDNDKSELPKVRSMD